MSYELYLPPELPRRNAVTGQFMKGHVPANKGKHWNDYMSKRAQKRAAKGWANLQKYRPTTRADTAGRARKQVIAVKISPQDVGDFYYMVRKHSRETCNTFHYLWRQLARLYPHIAQHYGDTFED